MRVKVLGTGPEQPKYTPANLSWSNPRLFLGLRPCSGDRGGRRDVQDRVHPRRYCIIIHAQSDLGSLMFGNLSAQLSSNLGDSARGFRRVSPDVAYRCAIARLELG